jgi:hypothetical protein
MIDINVNVHHYIHWDTRPGVSLADLHAVRDQMIGAIMATKEELEAQLAALADQSEKVRDEVVAGIQQLRDELAASGQTTPGIDAAVARIAGAMGVMDAIHDDAPPPPEPEPQP